MNGKNKYEAIVVGVSSGGVNALKTLLYMLPSDFPYAVIIVQHLRPSSDKHWIRILDSRSLLTIKEADEKEAIEKGTVYIAPPNYHLLIEKDKTLTLTIDERVNFARPSINVLFETAAEAYKNKLIGIILTGSNDDGTSGLQRIKEHGGLTIVQDPATAESPYMPLSAMNKVAVDHVLSLKDIGAFLINDP